MQANDGGHIPPPGGQPGPTHTNPVFFSFSSLLRITSPFVPLLFFPSSQILYFCFDLCSHGTSVASSFASPLTRGLCTAPIKGPAVPVPDDAIVASCVGTALGTASQRSCLGLFGPLDWCARTPCIALLPQNCSGPMPVRLLSSFLEPVSRQSTHCCRHSHPADDLPAPCQPHERRAASLGRIDREECVARLPPRSARMRPCPSMHSTGVSRRES